MNSSNESKTLPKIIINDLTGLGAFYEDNGIHADSTKLDSSRVIGTVDGTIEAYRLMGEFQSNPTVRLLDFLAAQRRLRGRMLDLRDGTMRDGRRERGTGHGQSE